MISFAIMHLYAFINFLHLCHFNLKNIKPSPFPALFFFPSALITNIPYISLVPPPGMCVLHQIKFLFTADCQQLELSGI